MFKNLSIPPKKPKIIVILGPTASGKSDLAVKIALRLSSGQAKKLYGVNDAEIISADSRQVYKGFNIGSGKITKKEMKGVPHHLIDVASPKRIFTVVQYQRLAKKALQDILRRGKLPIICGGTGFYIDALIYNYQLPKVPPQPELRKKLEKKTTEELFKQLKKLDPRRAKNIDRFNKRRLIRALEIVLITGKPVPNLNTNIRARLPSPLTQANGGQVNQLNQHKSASILKIGIKKSSEELKKLIKKRLLKRLKQGLIKEVRNLHNPPAGGGLSWQRLDELGLEYRYISRYLRGLLTRKQMINVLLKEIYKYAKRQLTWFKRDETIHWIKNYKEAENLAKRFLK